MNEQRRKEISEINDVVIVLQDDVLMYNKNMDTLINEDHYSRVQLIIKNISSVKSEESDYLNSMSEESRSSENFIITKRAINNLNLANEFLNNIKENTTIGVCFNIMQEVIHHLDEATQ